MSGANDVQLSDSDDVFGFTDEFVEEYFEKSSLESEESKVNNGINTQFESSLDTYPKNIQQQVLCNYSPRSY